LKNYEIIIQDIVKQQEKDTNFFKKFTATTHPKFIIHCGVQILLKKNQKAKIVLRRYRKRFKKLIKRLKKDNKRHKILRAYRKRTPEPKRRALRMPKKRKMSSIIVTQKNNNSNEIHVINVH